MLVFFDPNGKDATHGRSRDTRKLKTSMTKRDKKMEAGSVHRAIL